MVKFQETLNWVPLDDQETYADLLLALINENIEPHNFMLVIEDPEKFEKIYKMINRLSSTAIYPVIIKPFFLGEKINSKENRELIRLGVFIIIFLAAKMPPDFEDSKVTIINLNN